MSGPPGLSRETETFPVVQRTSIRLFRRITRYWVTLFRDIGRRGYFARDIGRIVMARGRDAGDVPITMCFGPSSLLRFDVVTDEVVEPRAAAAA